MHSLHHIVMASGVILESEDLHRRAYNAAFMHFDVRSPRDGRVVQWSEEFYNQLQNKIGGGKPKMRWFFGTPHNEADAAMYGSNPTN